MYLVSFFFSLLAQFSRMRESQPDLDMTAMEVLIVWQFICPRKICSNDFDYTFMRFLSFRNFDLTLFFTSKVSGHSLRVNSIFDLS